eukprot:c9493_g1_i2.p1 GENE.c9493_g1_i2~~c9493_g1_i2.p1  ORF type:complete len:151 (+),score=32.41 c9493_g1_i2:20-472(+)
MLCDVICDVICDMFTDNQIAEKGAEAIANVLSSGKCSITRLPLWGNTLSLPVCAMIDELSEKNIHRIKRESLLHKWYHFCLGHHIRVGAASPVAHLVSDIMGLIFLQLTNQFNASKSESDRDSVDGEDELSGNDDTSSELEDSSASESEG